REVGDDDGLDGGPYRRAAGYVAMLVLFRHQQLDPDPHQQGAAHYLQEGNVEQGKREGNQYDAQHNGARGAPQYALHSLSGRQVATGKSNDHRIVPTQQDVDQNDLNYGAPMERLDNFKHGSASPKKENGSAAGRCNRPHQDALLTDSK